MDLEEARDHLREEIDRIFDEELDGVLISQSDLAVVQDLLGRLRTSIDVGFEILLEEWREDNLLSDDDFAELSGRLSEAAGVD